MSAAATLGELIAHLHRSSKTLLDKLKGEKSHDYVVAQVPTYVLRMNRKGTGKLNDCECQGRGFVHNFDFLKPLIKL